MALNTRINAIVCVRRCASGFLGCWLAAGARLWAADPAPQHPRNGLSYLNDRIPDGPFSVHVVKIDRSRTDYELHTTLAKGKILGLSPLTEQIKSLPPELGQPIAAINGDFWRSDRQYEGDPEGLQILRGELVSGPTGRAAFWIDSKGDFRATNVSPAFKVTWPNGHATSFGLNEKRSNTCAVLYTPILGASTLTKGGREFVLERDGTNDWLPLEAGRTYSARVKEVRDTGNTTLTPDIMVLSLGPQLADRVPQANPGAVLRISTDTIPDLRGVPTAIGGGPVLVRNGQALSLKAFSTDRHPRTAVGWNETHVFFIEVDGRQRTLSVGMAYAELADYLVKQGCQEAMNLDGGASSTIWVRGQVMNSPCVGHERPMANSLVLVQKPNNHEHRK